jgi:putative superfamily III holin-X
MREQSTTSGIGGDARRPANDVPVTELFSGLARDTQDLLRNELALAKAEMTDSAKKMVSAVVKVAVGALVLYAGFLMLLWAAVFRLRQTDLSWWASALIVGGAALFVGLILTLWAKSQLKNASLAPTQTVDSLKDDRAWVKGQMP